MLATAEAPASTFSVSDAVFMCSSAGARLARKIELTTTSPFAFESANWMSPWLKPIISSESESRRARSMRSLVFLSEYMPQAWRRAARYV